MIFSGYALVVKNFFPKKNRIILLHEKLGKISCYVSKKHQASYFCNGSIVSVQVMKKQNYYHLGDVDLHVAPFNTEIYDIYFIHDILKICLEALPYHTPMDDLFGLIIQLYQSFGKISVEEQKLYLLQIFLLVEVFPENKDLYLLVMKQVDLQKQHYNLLDVGLKQCWALYNQQYHVSKAGYLY